MRPTRPQPPVAAPVWWCTWHTGPDAGGRQRLTVGRHIVGRGATVGADDPALEPHHALFEVTPDGTLTLTRLTGHTPIVTGVTSVTSVTGVTGVTRVTSGDWIELGHSLVHCTTGEPASTTPAHLLDRTLVRTPRTPSTWSPPELDTPQHLVGGSGLIPALLALAGAGLMALVMRQPMFLMFGVVGALVAVGTWLAQRIVVRRAHRRDRELLARSAETFATHHRASVQTIERARRTLDARDAALWSRRSTHHDAYLVSPGMGAVPVPLPSLGGSLADVPIGIDLGPGARVALRGPRAQALARSLVAQLITACGPADLRLVVTPARNEHWSHLDGLPHLIDIVDVPNLTHPGKPGNQTGVAEHTHVLHLTDRPEALALRTSPLRRALADASQHALLVVLDDGDAVPHLCTHVCTTTDGPWGSWSETVRTGDATPVRIAALGARAALTCSAVLRDLRDPEDPLTADDDLPTRVCLTELLGTSVAAVAAAWSRHAQRPDAGPSTPIGVAHDGVVDLDLVRDGPHALIAGTTGSGKSELLRSMVLGMAAQASPLHLTFVLVDYKGGATFDDLVALPHVVGVVTDLEPHLSNRVLRSLHAELRTRESVLREHRVADLPALRATAPHVEMPRLVVMIDEFAALVHEQPDFLHSLLGIAQRGRSLGMHLVLATQRPSGVISDDIRANTNLRIALRLHDSVDALDVVGISDPAHLPRHRPGRAVVRLGADEHVTFQTAVCEPARLVRSIVDATAAMAIALPRAPWSPPLATSLTADEVPVGALGLVDDPDQQAVYPLHWSPADGNLLVVGSAGSGTSTTVGSLARLAIANGGHHVYRLTDHDAAPIDGVVTVSVQERELVVRLLHRLSHRASDAAPVVLLVDSLDGVRRALDDPRSVDELDALDSLLQRADPNLVLIAVAVRPTAVPAAFLARCAHRWVHHLHDRHDAAHLGMTAIDVPPSIPGRIHLVSPGLAAQVAPLRSTPRLVHPAHIAPAEPLFAVPSMISSNDLDETGGTALGIGLLTGATLSIALHPGEHLTVLGGARTGRTTTLVRITAAWRTLHPTGTVTVVSPRRGRNAAGDRALRALADDALPTLHHVDTPRLLVVDDAELVDDPDGALAALATLDDGCTTFVIAGRPDALRQMYGHWTSIVRRSRNGLVAVSGNDHDGDLLGAILPRRTPVAARPGLMWCVIDGQAALVQVAADNHAAEGSRLAPR